MGAGRENMILREGGGGLKGAGRGGGRIGREGVRRGRGKRTQQMV